MITRIVKMDFKSEHISDFLSKFEQIKERVSHQSGCESMRLIQDIKNKNIFFTVSEWEREVDLNIYRQTPFFKSTWSTIKPWFASRAEAWSASSVWMSTINQKN